MTVARLRKQGLLALIIYFLMITALCAPMAFFAGKARGHVEAEAAALLSQIEPDLKPLYAAQYRARRAGAGCGGESDPDIDRKGYWEIICHPYEEGTGGVRIAGLDTRHAQAAGGNRPRAATNVRRRRGPLDDVVVAALAAEADVVTTALGAPGAGTIGSPLSLALAPDAAAIAAPLYDGNTMSGGFGLSGGPNAPGGLPGNIIPDIQTAGSPPLEPPTVVTPIPGALPLLLTGLAGLFAASKRKKRA